MKNLIVRLSPLVLALLIAEPLLSQGNPGRGNGPGFGGGRGQGAGNGQGTGRGMGRGMGRGFGQGPGAQQGAQGRPGEHGQDDRHDEDHEVFQFLLQNHDKIKRNVKELPNGVQTLTESDSPEIAEKIKEHVEWMQYRVENTNPIRMRDPLFAEIFQHADKIKMVHKETKNGVQVTETSEDPYVVKLIQAHAEVVSGFVARGFAEAMKNHAVPGGDNAKLPPAVHPVIANHGAVVPLPNAAQQPRAGTKLLVDLTSGGAADKLNSGLVKVAKYLNIFAGAGAQPADVQIAVVFHGDATLAVLNPDAYAEKFHTDGNPNLLLLQQLHESGVELYVCGQSLISKGSTPDDVAVFVETAVSALTAVVNLQADGFAYVPLSQSVAPSPTATTSSEPLASAANDANASAEEAHDHGPMPGGGMGRGMGMGRGQGMGRGPGAMQQEAGGLQGMQGDMSTLHAMFADRDKIKRTIKNLPDGAEAFTESDDEAIAEMLKEHVPAMEDRVLGNKPLPPMTFHPIFVELIKHADDYTLTYDETEKGVKVRYQSDDPYVVMLVQEHAKLVSRFIKNGMEEIHAPYTLPKMPKGSGTNGR